MIHDEAIATAEIAPTVLFCHHFPDDYGLSVDTFPQLPLRRTYDYEIELILTDSGSMLLDDRQYQLRRGSVIFRRPGIRAQALAPYRCCSVVVDITGKSGKSRDNYIFKSPQQVQTDYRNPILDHIAPLTDSDETEKLVYLFDRIYKEFKANWPQTPLILRGYVLEILYTLYAEAIRVREPASVQPKRHHKAIRKATQYINENYAGKIKLSDIAAYAGLSANYLSRLFIDCMGVNLSAFICSIRVQKAKELLIYTSLPIADIAGLCGFESQAYFIYVFNRIFQTTPGKFRTQYV